VNFWEWAIREGWWNGNFVEYELADESEVNGEIHLEIETKGGEFQIRRSINLDGTTLWCPKKKY